MTPSDGPLSDPDTTPFGTYRPKGFAHALLWIVRLGLARGTLSRQLRKFWNSRLPTTVDIERRGIRYRLNVRDNVTDAKILLSSKVYDREELEHLANACDDGTFIDIGANTGYYSLRVAAAGARQVLAIEPNPPTFRRLLFNLECNRFAEAIQALPLAIGPNGTAMLHLAEGLGSASLNPSEQSRGNTVEVQTEPLLDVLTNAGIERIDGLKIDIEGYEYQALEPFFRDAAPSLHPRCIVIESCHGHIWEKDVLALLREHGYQIQSRSRSNSILYLS